MKSFRKSTADIKELARNKVFMIESFIYGANKIFKNVNYSNEKEVAHCAINYFQLHALTLELIIKSFYELEHKREAARTHDILEIYEKLGTDNKKFIETEFNAARDRKLAGIKKLSSSPSAIQAGINIESLNSCIFHTLKEVLIENKKTIVHLKYAGMAPRTNLPYDDLFYKNIINFITNYSIEEQ